MGIPECPVPSLYNGADASEIRAYRMAELNGGDLPD